MKLGPHGLLIAVPLIVVELADLVDIHRVLLFDLLLQRRQGAEGDRLGTAQPSECGPIKLYSSMNMHVFFFLRLPHPTPKNTNSIAKINKILMPQVWNRIRLVPYLQYNTVIFRINKNFSRTGTVHHPFTPSPAPFFLPSFVDPDPHNYDGCGSQLGSAAKIIALEDASPRTKRPRMESIDRFAFKGTVSRDFSSPVFFIKQLLLVPKGMPRNDFEFFRKFVDLFVFVINSPVMNTPGSRLESLK